MLIPHIEALMLTKFTYAEFDHIMRMLDDWLFTSIMKYEDDFVLIVHDNVDTPHQIYYSICRLLDTLRALYPMESIYIRELKRFHDKLHAHMLRAALVPVKRFGIIGLNTRRVSKTPTSSPTVHSID